MHNLVLFALVILIGIYIKQKYPIFVEVNKNLLHKMAWYNLLLVVLLQFWSNGIEVSYIYLIAVGFMLHLFPVSLSIILRKRGNALSNYMLAYSTFGGGNRGVLALTLLSPSLLPQFFILDIGIFLSLLLVYPIASRVVANNESIGNISLNCKSLQPVIITSSLIIAGTALHELGWIQGVSESLFVHLKTILLIVVSLYLGVHFNFQLHSITSELTKIIACRMLGVLAPVVVVSYLVFPDELMNTILILVALSSFLPVSSLAPQLTPSGQLREWVATQVIISSALYVAILGVLAIIKQI
jgi:hypothetical protein